METKWSEFSIAKGCFYREKRGSWSDSGLCWYVECREVRSVEKTGLSFGLHAELNSVGSLGVRRQNSRQAGGESLRQGEFLARGTWEGDRELEAATATSYKPARVNNRPSDVIAPRDTSVAFKWLLSRLCLDADVDLWNSIKLHGIPYRPNRVVVLGASPLFRTFCGHPSFPTFCATIFYFFPRDERVCWEFITKEERTPFMGSNRFNRSFKLSF